MITQYQNCAPAPNMRGPHTVTHDDGQVDVINHVTTAGAVSFAQKSVAIDDAALSVVLNGSCRQDQIGAIFHWELRDSNGQVLLENETECSEKGFEVQIDAAPISDCESTYAVVAQLGVDESEAVHVNRICR